MSLPSSAGALRPQCRKKNGATQHEVTRAGLTGKWHPNEDLTVVGESIYKGKELSNFLYQSQGRH